jgi:hypothetical protein
LGDALPRPGIWALRAVLLCPPVILLLAALPRFASGIALEAAFPVPSYMIVDRALPINATRTTAHVLAGADEADGEAQIARSRAAYLSGEVGPKIIAMADNGLSHAPTSAAGWTLLAALRTPVDRARAAAAMSVALELAPHDYYLAAWRARTAAPLWTALPADARESAARQVRLLWSDHTLRRQIRSILAVPGGPSLVTYAMKDDPDGLRALNRMVARERLGLPDGN